MRDHFSPLNYLVDSNDGMLMSARDDESQLSMTGTDNQPSSSPQHLLQHQHNGEDHRMMHRSASTSTTVSDRSATKREASSLYERNQYNGSEDDGSGNNDDDSIKQPRAILDFQSLQSSLKRVRLSLSPGELRLRRDLEILHLHGWLPLSDADDSFDFPELHTIASNDTMSWYHSTIGARLVLVDSLRLCLFLPASASNATSNNLDTMAVEESLQYAGEQSHQDERQHRHHRHCHQHHSSHPPMGSRRKIWIQIPRRYPHKPPVVSRIEGLAGVERIVVNDAPPPPQSVSDNEVQTRDNSNNETRGIEVGPSLTRSQSADAVSALLPLQEQDATGYGSHIDGAAWQTTTQETSMSSPADAAYRVCVGGTTVVWNHWSPIVSLVDLIDFLLRLAAARPMPDQAGHNHCNINPGSLSLSRFASFHSLYGTAITSLGSSTKAGFIEEHKMQDTASSSDAPSTVVHLPPNRFDVGYEKLGKEVSSSGNSNGSDSIVGAFRSFSQDTEEEEEEDDAMDL